MTSPLLAIVIPAYKAEFLDAALASIAQQDLSGCEVFVGDDASPEDIGSVCACWQTKMSLRYYRFPANLGATNLVSQWERCIASTKSDWVWLFSDDDMMGPGCVAAAKGSIAESGGKYDLFHFNVDWVDRHGTLIKRCNDFPQEVSGWEFANLKLAGAIDSFAPDFIFSRSVWTRSGGFVQFPLAWCSDDATWVKFAGSKGIRTIPGPRVQWRESGRNIGSFNANTQVIKARAALRYIKWLRRYATTGENGQSVAGEAWQRTAARWLRTQIDGLRYSARCLFLLHSVAAIGVSNKAAVAELLGSAWPTRWRRHS